MVGRGGEALVCGGYCNGHKVVVRKAVAPRRDFWRSPDGQTVIKVITNILMKDATYSVNQLIYREMITHALLDHPNIIPFLGVYRENTEGPPMTVLPFIERGSLGDVIREKAIHGVEFVWIVRSISRNCQTIGSSSSAYRLLELVVLWHTFTRESLPFSMVIFIR